MQRIALFIPAFSGGGAENVFTILANYWANEGVAVDYLVCSGEGPMRERLDSRVNIIELVDRGGMLFRRLCFAQQIAKYCKQNKPSLLLCTLTYCNQIAIMAKSFWGIGDTTLVVREANSLANQRKTSVLRTQMNFFLMRILYPRADWISANSDYTLDELESVIGLPREKRALVRNPVELRQVENSIREGVPVVLGCGRLIPQKDFETLIRAVARVRAVAPCHLVIIGDGPERERLRALGEELGFGEAELSLPGFVSDPERSYRKANVFVLPSKWEGLPNVVLEALSFGLPVVATDCSGGTREIFTEMPKNHLVSVGDVDEMSEKILGFIETPPTPEAMQAVLSGRYDVSTIASCYCALIKPASGAHSNL